MKMHWGLGLSLTRSLVELHGGRIWAESEGKGEHVPICDPCSFPLHPPRIPRREQFGCWERVLTLEECK